MSSFVESLLFLASLWYKSLLLPVHVSNIDPRIKLTTARSSFLYAPFFFIMVRLYFCAFMSVCVIFVHHSFAVFLTPDILKPELTG